MTQPITITEPAAKAIAEKTAAKAGAHGLRLNIKSTGCSGHSYAMEYVMEESDADEIFQEGDAVLYIPRTHSWMLFGMTIDFEQGAMGGGFTFTNPNETGRCGCGESFTVERKPS
jgi:iron-sulfur cluster assembly protein